MEKQTQNTAAQKRYVPYGINGEYFVYDNDDNHIPMGYGSKGGKKKAIQTMCDKLNAELQPQGTAHTPGEWKVWLDTDGYVIGTKDEKYIAKTCSIRGDECSHEEIANAELIASAVNNTAGKGINPEAVGDMLEALKKAKQTIETLALELNYSSRRWVSEHITPIENAINKATNLK